MAGSIVPTDMAANFDASVKEDGRVRLLKAAKLLFSQGGYEETSVAELLKHSGLRAPSLYHHFGDKEGLFVDWALDTFDEISAELATATTLNDCASVLLNGARIDFLQLMRDLRVLKEQAYRDSVRESLRIKIVAPIAAILKQSESLEPSTLPEEEAWYFLHSVMYCHPRYCSQRPAGRINGMLTKWVIDRFVP